jgi:GWxTD domain-containing protein
MKPSYLRSSPLLGLFIAFSLSVATAQNDTSRVRGTPVRVVVEKVSKKWLTEDVVHIITDQEREDFKSLTTDHDRDDFIEKFWESRNPNPGSHENKFKEEHYRRIAYSNEHFTGGYPGWKADRSRIYIIYGPPDSIESNPGSSPPTEIWHYAYKKGIGRNVVLDFIDNRRCGDYGLTKGEVDSLPRTFDHMNPQ